MKRIALFILTNILVLVTISLVINILGVQPYLNANGIDYYNLMIFCLIWGMGGSLISLGLSRIMAKTMMGVKTIKPGQSNELDELINMVTRISRAAGLSTVPEVGVYESPDVNAFATGPSKSRSLVAFSSGLLRSMNRDQIEGVAAHEIAHISNGDMVTMTLIQGVVNAFVMFFARIIAFAVSQSVKEEQRRMVQFIVVLALDIVLGILGSMVVFWFSRHREFRADAGSARFVGRDKMIAALQFLGRLRAAPEDHASIATLKISGKSSGWINLLASHPPIEQRIRALESMQR